MKYTHLLAASLIVLSLFACDRPKQALPEAEKANFEKMMRGEQIDCPHGLDGNGNCLKEGASALPYGGTGKPGH